MSEALKDPMGQAILDFSEKGSAQDIIVSSEICDDDIIPVPYLFRTYNEMPKIEQFAMSRCEGKILDIGAGAGIHTRYLIDHGKDVLAIDTSPLTVDFLKKSNLPAELQDFFTLEEGDYDTLLMLMNGIGIAGSLENLDATLIHAKKLTHKGGRLICDSSDIKYLYEDDEGGYWVDLNTSYYGNFRYQMKYGAHASDWFDWLYVDFDKLKEAAERTGWHAEKIVTNEDEYLAELTLL